MAYLDGELDTVGFLTAEEHGITAVHVIRNPAKLGRVTHTELID